MRGHLKDAIKHQVLHRSEERIRPIPGKICDDAMGIRLDPEIEDEEGNSSNPAQDTHENSFAVGRIREGEE